jgi:hypothetical protein
MFARIILLACLNLFLVGVRAQSAYKPDFKELKALEGTYEYTGNSTLQIAASSRDTMLYALIGTSRYKLRPFKKDIFLNGGNQEVAFVREAAQITGYKVKDEQPEKLYKLISGMVTFSDSMWFARPAGQQYVYKIPEQTNDGFAKGSLKTSGLDVSLINTTMERIIEGTYPNIHGVILIKDGKLILEE